MHLLLPLYYQSAMLPIKKISYIALLMIVSEVLIAVFAVRWLYSEYNTEKMLLQKNLFEQFMSARSRVMDSVIAKNFIGPLLTENEGMRIRTMHHTGDSTGIDSLKVIAFNTHVDTIWKSRQAPELRLDENSTSIRQNLTLELKTDSIDKDLYRGVKLFISKVAGPEGEAAYFNRHIETSDTALIQQYFSENLQQQNLNVKTLWIRNQPSTALPPPLFYFESRLFEEPYAAKIEDYNQFLLTSILSQLFFALLLLLITGFAFSLTYKSLRSQQRLAVLKDDFISNMSHELKTPLATMKVAVEAMREMDPVSKKETMQDYLGMTSQEITRLDLLINNIMNSMLIEHMQQPLRNETMNVEEAIENVLRSFKLNPAHEKMHFRLTADAGAMLIEADEVHVQGIFYNLIDNSLKYGGENVVMAVHLTQTPNQVIVTFSDNGPGIPQAYLHKVFDKFFRVPTGDRHNVKGYGLGLNYVAQVMKQLGGSVSAKNLQEGGCRFTLEFPKRS